MVSYPSYPINLDLGGESCLVVGGGNVAARKVRGLLDCGAHVTVVAPAAVDWLRIEPRVRWHERDYRRGEAASYRLVIAATGAPDVDAQVAADARATGIPVNSADDPANCTFTLPAIVRKGDLQVTVSTHGRSPAFASWLKREIDAQLTTDLMDTFELIAAVRAELKAAGRSTEHPGWERVLCDDLVSLVAKGERDEARLIVLRELEAGDLAATAAP